MSSRPPVCWCHVICRGAAGVVRAMAIAQEMSFPLRWVSPHSHTLTEWNKRGFSLPGSRTSGAGLNQKASIAMKLIAWVHEVNDSCCLQCANEQGCRAALWTGLNTLLTHFYTRHLKKMLLFLNEYIFSSMIRTFSFSSCEKVILSGVIVKDQTFP